MKLFHKYNHICKLVIDTYIYTFYAIDIDIRVTLQQLGRRILDNPEYLEINEYSIDKEEVEYKGLLYVTHYKNLEN